MKLHLSLALSLRRVSGGAGAHRAHPRLTLLAAAACLSLPFSLDPQPLRAQAPAAPQWRSALPFAEPVVDAAAQLQANRAVTWSEGEARLLLLEGDVSVAVGAYGFRAQRAVVRIDEERRPGRLVRHLSLYLDQARPLRGRGATTAEAPRLLVTVSTTGQVELTTHALQRESAPGIATDPLVVEAAQRMTRHLASLRGRPLDVPEGPPVLTPAAAARREQRRREVDQAAQRREAPPEAPEVARVTPAPRAPGAPAPPVTVTPVERILPAEGVVAFRADRLVYDAGRDGQQPSLALMGQVRVMYQAGDGSGRGMTLTAENAVLFLDKTRDQDLPGTRLEAGEVRGIYLEDNVIATDGQYTLRAPRVYYDPTLNKALVLDAVMYTWDVRRNIPIYVRAEVLRQESRAVFSAQQALVTTSEFAVPHFSIGAAQLTVREVRAQNGGVERQFAARDAVIRAGKVPLFAWPALRGNAQDTAIRDIDAGFHSQYGPFLRTQWDMFALAGKDKPEGVDLIGKVDYLGERGPGLGLDLDYAQPHMSGFAETYLAPLDQSESKIGARDEVGHDDTRGLVLWRHRHYLSDDWELSLEAAYVSDELFLEEYFPRLAARSKAFETSLYLKRQEQDWAFTFLTAYHLNDFTAQTPVLESLGYTVDRLPELGYYRVGTSLWGDRLTYYTENRASRMRIRAGDDNPKDRGFKPAQSLALFGIPADTDFDDALRAAGVPLDYRNRLDSRHEIQAPMKGPGALDVVDVVPYVSGRFTGYDKDFEDFSGEDDNIRLLGTAGVRLHTLFARSYQEFDSRLLDLHRLRHVIEPSVDLFAIGSTIDPEDIPIYDAKVEDLREGSGVRAGLRNTLQTQRGGPGRWRSVDWIILNTDFVYRGDDTGAPTLEQIPRFYAYRPEYSLGGDHFHTDLMWMVSDTLAGVGELTYDFEENLVAQWRVGGSLQHSPDLQLFTDYVEIEPMDSRIFSYGFTYRLTTKYTMGFRHILDLRDDGSREIELTLIRRLPRWRMVMLFRHDEIDDDQTVGVVLVPEGIGSARRASDPFDTARWMR